MSETTPLQLPAGYRAVVSSHFAAVGFFRTRSHETPNTREAYIKQPIAGAAEPGPEDVRVPANLTHGQLEILFPSGQRWGYGNVPASLVYEFLGAPSKGSFFASRIKKHPDQYPPFMILETPGAKV